ncbi:hypothetical protein GCM10022281_10020 [Sphingomonas rosea]|uniref:Phytase-like domain-containing protein n=1 Tax=Sphingomonas rosea TaxID=335605 RepID=A0ABP7TX57_9SPHN
MRDSQLNEPERRPQHLFRLLRLPAALATLLMVAILHGDGIDSSPDRVPAPPSMAAIHYTPIPLPALGGPTGWRVTGAWKVSGTEPRLAGLSGLLIGDSGHLLAISDSGVLVTLPKPGSKGPGRFADLPDGPGVPTFRRFRDSEAIARQGAQTWVTFENRHSLWIYGGGPPRRLALPAQGWKRNAGVEAMVFTRAGLLMLPEESDSALLYRGGRRFASLSLAGRTGGIADATRLPDGRVIVAVREVTALGLRNRLALLERDGAGLRLRRIARLSLGPFDNVEGLAAERLADGATRLWAVTDNDGWRRTLLLRIDISEGAAANAPAPRAVSGQ